MRVVVRRIELEPGPRRIVLLLDTSGSMGLPNSVKWQNAAMLAKAFVAEVQGDDLISLEVFADKHESLLPFTRDVQSVVQAIDAFIESGRGRTRVGIALTSVLEAHEKDLRLGDAVVLVSDGEYSVEDAGEIKRLGPAFLGAGLRLFLLRPPNWGDFPQRDTLDVSSFVIETGGSKFDSMSSFLQPGNPVDKNQVRAIGQRAYRFIRDVYRAELEVQEPLRNRRKLTCGLVDEQGRKEKRVTVLCPKYLVPLTVQP